ncbi:hypothetical protein C3747_55g52 [Trypanosoma cruzi]|uniref:Uncharacterized protein n=2 Tax=Trypanosoma cruzi TaxID=5693 RepID=Q4DEY5_TRYCC|nr:hypothetical protein Tc00.1047053506223.70 [Trypanosoma cruzi]EAN91086.1 hypothetical protein Tc00.1047053506223.70 [Trypanosoma cruzi]PWV11919.1 hypothetical protein C3747_55g52 [Trypanosoma cruzi]RNC60489.1 hypothetical protein TcCL_ESM01834 [Trypanosoma cruzi]|eukprot:XP_812937.1 hypothetical protein [Trypanosoma cruzi strain CL Brener]
MSVSTRTSVTQWGNGSYSEALIPPSRSERHHIPRLIPVLDSGSDEVRDCSVILPPLGPSLAYVAAAPVKHARRDPVGKGPTHTGDAEFVVKWKGLSAEQVERNLTPLLYHYRQQLLLLEERRRRRIIFTEEFTQRIELSIHCRYSAPFRERLLSWNILDTLSRRLEAACSRSCHSSRMISPSSSYIRRSRGDDPFYTPSWYTSVTHGSPRTRDSATARSVQRPVFGFMVSAFGQKLEEHLRNASTPEHFVQPRVGLKSSGQSTAGKFLTVSSRLEASEEMGGSQKNCTPLTKESKCDDSLTVSPLGKSLSTISGEDSLDRSVASCKSHGDDDDDDESLVHLMLAATMTRRSTQSGGGRKEL